MMRRRQGSSTGSAIFLRKRVAALLTAAATLALSPGAPAASGQAVPACQPQDAEPPKLFEVGDGPTYSAAGDFDRDGKLDLAYANFCDHEVAVLPGDGRGGFGSPRTFAVGYLPATMVAGDFDRDQRLDLAVANSGDHDVTVLLGDGRGDFTPVARTFAVGNSPRGMAHGDFNEDGRLDLAVAAVGVSPFPVGCQNKPDPTHEPALSEPAEQSVAILLGDGRGGFIGELGHEARFVEAGPNPSRIAAGDVDGDGDLDLAAANASTGTVTVLAGDGRGDFVGVATHAVGQQPFFVVLEDLSRDGVLDIATADSSSGTVSVLLGLGGGRLAARRSYTISEDPRDGSPRDIAVADLNRDGLSDLAVSYGQHVALMLGKGGGEFGARGDPDHFADAPGGGGIEPVVAARFDRDRFPDLALGLSFYDLFGDDRVSILLNPCGGQ